MLYLLQVSQFYIEKLEAKCAGGGIYKKMLLNF